MNTYIKVIIKVLGCVWAFTATMLHGQSLPLLSPTVIGAAGEVSKSSSMIIEWTLGETFVESIKTPSVWHTQGFHQPTLMVRQIVKTLPTHQVNIYPNPASAILNVSVRTDLQEPLVLKMIDVTGKIVLLKDAPGGPQDLQLAVHQLPEGMYILSVVRQNGAWITSFKVIKH